MLNLVENIFINSIQVDSTLVLMKVGVALLNNFCGCDSVKEEIIPFDQLFWNLEMGVAFMLRKGGLIFFVFQSDHLFDR